MEIIRDISPLRALLDSWRRAGERIALVPTMGNLHAGHLTLLDAARAQADRIVVSIFVNPIQFVADEDYAAYPRTADEDRRQLQTHAVDLLFMPDVQTLFPHGLESHTRVTVPGLDDILCGASRPGHFTGVATVVTKLLNLVQPDVAVFGEKDYQQLLIIRRLVADLALPVPIVPVPTVRADDGLALSSRNSYLDTRERAAAPMLYRILRDIAERITAGDTDYAVLEQGGIDALRTAGMQPDYLVIRAADTLETPAAAGPVVILAAARLGTARLIDNILVARDN